MDPMLPVGGKATMRIGLPGRRSIEFAADRPAPACLAEVLHILESLRIGGTTGDTGSGGQVSREANPC